MGPGGDKESAELGPGWYGVANAFSAHLDGDAKLARRRLTLLVEQSPDSPAGQSAAELLMKMKASGYAIEDPLGTRKPTGLARAELAIYQTVAGIVAGGFFCVAVDCDDARKTVALLAAGGGLGLAGSLILTRKGVSPGRTLAINSGTSWGIWNGLAFGLAVNGIDDEGVFGSIVVGQLLGVAAGIAGALYFDPRAGDVAFPTSVGMWTGGLTALLLGLSDAEFNQSGFFAALLIASDLGLAGGAVLSRLGIVEMSRSRSLLIDSGGVVGLLLGIGLPVLIQGDNVDETPVFAGGVIGMLGGLALSTYLTRNWDAPDTEFTLGIAPVENGAMAVVGTQF